MEPGSAAIGRTTGAPSGNRPRVWAVDAARGAAILAMVIFHFARDMEMFGLAAPGSTLTGGWAVTARITAGSFLFLSGVSLSLAHKDRIQWRAFARRNAVLALAALLVTIATFAAMPDSFVYFGILHAILAASIIGLAFVGRPAGIPITAAAAVATVWVFYGRSLPLPPWLGWTGLAMSPRPALDLIPIVPWLAPAFLGIGLGKLLNLRKQSRQAGLPVRLLCWLGRKSLIIYLLHQPLLIGVIWGLSRLHSG
ncbi:heparan-alpha-glucosaminide N-acetyltransferase [Leisingera daeponensis]|nr:heparan-alpha-glucosaminide N-acetyltransferase [Leisingera daeponensis]